ncbi:hypothetical protein MRB53_028219 [Persea americana]|uniref:Uncharacterized protein n=1 Tax=Persea americana TaxID=3435 RepID=A0ACC2KFE4_PERAE|nr:hypothetical protein MRB53_028219 [Persea americana]
MFNHLKRGDAIPISHFLQSLSPLVSSVRPFSRTCFSATHLAKETIKEEEKTPDAPKALDPICGFDFKSYMLQKANSINQALERAELLHSRTPRRSTRRCATRSSSAGSTSGRCFASPRVSSSTETRLQPCQRRRELKEASKRHGKLLIEILQRVEDLRVENLRTAKAAMSANQI